MRTDKYQIVAEYILKYQDKFYRFAYSYAKNKDDALDIVQNAVYKALIYSSKLKDPESTKTWVYRIVCNEALNYMKKRNRYCELDFDIEDTREYRSEDYSDLYKELDKLPEETKIIVKLYFFEEMTLKEISLITNTNISTVKSRLYKGLRILKLKLKDSN